MAKMDMQTPARIRLTRPYPPADLADVATVSPALAFQPAPDVAEWLRAAFIDEESPAYNPEHAHLADADVACLWAGVEHVKNQRRTLGTCECIRISGDPWKCAQREQQLLQWFGRIPDFLITLSAPYAAGASNAEWCALVEHELLHASFKVDEYGEPKCNPITGGPIWSLKGHDCEQMVNVVERYGAAASDVLAIVEASRRRPSVSMATIRAICGGGE